MKNIFNRFSQFLTPILLLVLMGGCSEKESEGISKITYYPVFSVNGSNPFLLKMGTPYIEPGVKVTEGGLETTYKTTIYSVLQDQIVTKVNETIPDQYDVKYSTVNKDGILRANIRKVYVFNTGDFADNIEGLYTASIVRTGPDIYSIPVIFNDLKYVLVWKTGLKTYHLSDAIGGYYAIGRNYGNSYMAKGCTFDLIDITKNSISAGPGFSVGVFGDGAVLQGVKFDVAKRKIAVKVVWNTTNDGIPATYIFEVTLTQVQP